MQKTLYYNSLMSPITAQQALLMDDHIREIFEDNIKVFKLTIRDKELDYVRFYNSQNIMVAEAITLVTAQYPNVGFELISETTIGAYVRSISLAYNGKTLDYEGKSIELLDSNGYIICREDYDEFDEFEELNKYARNSDGREFIFRYSTSDLSLWRIDAGEYLQFITVEYFETLFPEFLATHPYYQDGTFFSN